MAPLSTLLTNLSSARAPIKLRGVPLPKIARSGACESMPWTGDAFDQSMSHIFFHENRDKPLAHVESSRRQRARGKRCSDLVDEGQPFLYVSEELTPGFIGNPVEHISVVDEVTSMLAVHEVAAAPTTLNVWMGGRGIVAAAHYDLHHNCFLQLSGTKLWTLARPTEALRLRPFPEAHPRDRQSQAGLAPLPCDVCETPPSPLSADEAPANQTLSADEWPSARAEAQVLLRPGELLYLPPLTFHRVAAPTSGLSVSLNAFSSSHENEAEREMVELANAFLKWMRSALKHSVGEVPTSFQLLAAWLRAVIRDAVIAHTAQAAADTPPLSVAAFLDVQLSSRWSPLYASLGGACSDFNPGLCPRAARALPDDMLAEVDQQAAEAAAALAARIKGLGWKVADAAAVRELIVVRFVELVVRKVMGSDRMCVFLRCLALLPEGDAET
jgi:hypothetical protein